MPHTNPDAQIFVFTRPPVPGKCKTRLIQHLGEEGAAILQENLIQKIITDIVDFKLCPLVIWQSEPTDYFVKLALNLTSPISIQTQSGADLGDRMAAAFATGLQHATKILLIGSDCVEYSKAYLSSALQLLDKHEVVIGPALDGGYVLIGARRFYPQLFKNVSWGTATVLTETVFQLERNHISFSMLKPLHDIDTVTDLEFANQFVGKTLQNK